MFNNVQLKWVQFILVQHPMPIVGSIEKEVEVLKVASKKKGDAMLLKEVTMFGR